MSESAASSRAASTRWAVLSVFSDEFVPPTSDCSLPSYRDTISMYYIHVLTWYHCNSRAIRHERLFARLPLDMMGCIAAISHASKVSLPRAHGLSRLQANHVSTGSSLTPTCR
jgi:hypothetical protein